jgi:acyl-coenzyme A thioesterase PaaI-like protein
LNITEDSGKSDAMKHNTLQDEAIKPVRQDEVIKSVRHQYHPRCYVCGCQAPRGLYVDYKALPEGRVEAAIGCPETWEGFAGVVHGGIIASLLDGAMTNCLFAHDIAAVTADLQVRFRHPVVIGHPALVDAELTRDATPVFVVRAKLVQDGQVRATSIGKFVKRVEPKNGGGAES